MSWVASVPWRFVGCRSVFGLLPFGKEKRARGGPAGAHARSRPMHATQSSIAPMQKRRAGTGVPWAGVVVFLVPLSLMCLLVFFIS
jgi:hypothetical protein